MSEAGSSGAPPAPPAISASRNAAAIALEDVPEQFKCPVCKEVYLVQVLQCPKGHPVCLECQLKSGNPEECSQCRAPMKTGDSDWIRVRMVEEILDAMRFACPFRKYGCQETLSRCLDREHKEGCRFDPDWAQICKYFKNGNACDYWTRTGRPEEALEHLKNHLDALKPGGKPKARSFSFNVAKPIPKDYVEAIVTKKNGATFLTTVWSDKTSDSFSFACIRLDKGTPGGNEAATKIKVRLTLERVKPRPRFKVRDWKITVPIVPLWQAPCVLEYKPSIVSRPFLKNYLLKDRFEEAERNRSMESDDDEDSSDDNDEDAVKARVLVSFS